MREVKTKATITTVVIALAFGSLVYTGPLQRINAQTLPAQGQAPQGRRGGGGGAANIYRARVMPNWFHNNTRFWYRNDLRRGMREFIVVDAEAGTRLPAFDHEKLAAGLSKAAGAQYQGNQLPFEAIEFSNDGKAITFSVAGVRWKCDLNTYECVKTGSPTARLNRPSQPAGLRMVSLAPGDDPRFGAPQPQEGTLQGGGAVGGAIGGGRRGGAGAGFGARGGVGRAMTSPDGKWTAMVRDNNVFVRDQGGKETQLSQDGREGLAYGMLQWSPNSKGLVGFRTEPGENKEVYRIQSSPPGGGRAVLQTQNYPLPGDKFAAYEPNVWDMTTMKQTKPQTDRIDFGRPNLHWKSDGIHFMYEKQDRGHQRVRIVEINSLTGAARNLIDEKTNTFIWRAHAEALDLQPVNYLDRNDEILYVSEQDGWRHMYLYDTNTGTLKNQLDKGEFVLKGIDQIDETNREVWFRAMGVYPGQDPYLIHYGRVKFDGTGLTWLTAGNGNHTIVYSPDRKYIVDTYSRVDMPPVIELRRVSDGKLVTPLEKADTTDANLSMPEVFVAKGRDGKTDIWGIIARPANFDPTKKYPILEDIYAGPQSAYTPKTFSAAPRYQALTNLGFVVVKMDAMGTALRSKAFHDVCWQNLKDAGFPDRILWMKAMATKYPYMDINRVGVYGTSAGGQNAAAAVIFHPEFYKAAVANSGCHDNRMDKASWNEQWMGYPVGPQYSASSNIDNAAKLGGSLMLSVGELDDNVPPENTYRLTDALIKANKDFDLLVIPGGGHGSGGAWGQRKLQDFFMRNLQGAVTPNRNTLQANG